MKDEYEIIIEMARQADDGALIFDSRSGAIIFINEVAKRFTGLETAATMEDLQRLLSRVSPDDQQYIKTALEEIRTTGLTEIEISLLNGSERRDLCITGYVLLNKSISFLFLKDITKAKQHESYLLEFGTKKNTILDGIVHFTSGAVSLMRNLSEQAERSIQLNNTTGIKSYLKLIGDNSNHCLEVIEDLLQEEHGRSARVSKKNSRINIVEKVGYIIQNLRTSYPRRVFDYIRPPVDPIVEVDGIKMLQIVNNFAFNAIKFSAVEMPITITIAHVDRGIEVRVTDLGIGIPLQLRPYIFDRKTSAGRTGLNGEKSFGVGLAICKELADIMDCKIWFESIEGKGSTFALFIPET